ncbi:MAG: site-specific DNA-methyltransferase [Aminobacterium colombiense]|nr:site-specific DNA-methyltransferase [Aminobacterium colombiense]
MPKKYVPYFPEPVEGQALLNNFRRTLRYSGDTEVFNHIRRGMPYYELERIEQVGSAESENMVIRGECLSTCAYMKEHGIEADLVYIDPPFASGADYAKQVYIRRNPKVAEAIRKAEKELKDKAKALADVGEEVDMTDEFRTFEEKMYGDIWDKERYLNWMFENLVGIKSVMSETASIYVHLDWHIGHYVKILMDEIFGEDNFINEIIWSYKSGGVSKNYFARKHDSIYLYGNGDDFIFNIQKEKSYNRGMKPYNFKGVEEFQDDVGWYTLVNMRDVWDLNMVGRSSGERVDYATQKPEALLERIIKASSNEGMLVCDFFGGSGVTAAVASKLNRRFITCDIGLNSVQTMRDRLYKDEASFSVYEIQDGVSLFRNPVQTMDKLYSLIPGLKKDETLSDFWAGSFTHSRQGRIPAYVPNLLDSSAKILDLPAMNEIVHLHLPDLPPSTKKVVLYYIDLVDEDELKKFISDENPTMIEVELRDLKAVLSDVDINDEIEWTLEEDKHTLLQEYVVRIDRFISDRVLGKIQDYNARSLAQSTGRKKFKPIQISNTGLECIEYLSLDCTSDSGKWHSDSEIKIDKKGYITVNGNDTKDFWDGTIRADKEPLRLKVRNICGDESIINLKNTTDL